MEFIDMLGYLLAAWLGASICMLIIQVVAHPNWAVNDTDWHCAKYDFSGGSWNNGKFYTNEYNASYLIIAKETDLAWKYCTVWEKNKDCSKTC